jgi:hypothetical protein
MTLYLHVKPAVFEAANAARNLRAETGAHLARVQLRSVSVVSPQGA